MSYTQHRPRTLTPFGWFVVTLPLAWLLFAGIAWGLWHVFVWAVGQLP